MIKDGVLAKILPFALEEFSPDNQTAPKDERKPSTRNELEKHHFTKLNEHKMTGKTYHLVLKLFGKWSIYQSYTTQIAFGVKGGGRELDSEGFGAAPTLIQGVNLSFSTSRQVEGKWSAQNHLWGILANWWTWWTHGTFRFSKSRGWRSRCSNALKKRARRWKRWELLQETVHFFRERLCQAERLKES